MKIFMKIFLAAAVVGHLACSKNSTGLKETVKDPRQYMWTVDTLAYPGSFQTGMVDIWGSSPKDVYVVGDNERGFGKMFHFDGENWKPVGLHPLEGGTIPGTIELEATYGFSPNDIWAVGERTYDNPKPPPNILDSTLIIRYDGSAWTEVQVRPRKRFLLSIWANSPTDIWMGGINGTLYHYDGVSIKEDSVPMFIPKDASPGYGFYSITGKSSDEVYMLLWAPPPGLSLDRYYLFRRQGNTWAVTDSMLYQYFNSIWMSPSGALYATGSAVRRREGHGWNEVLPGFTSTAIFGTSDESLFVVGESGITDSHGEVYHHNGVDWFQFQKPRLPNVLYTGIWTDGREVFVVAFTLGFTEVSIVLHGK